MNTFTVYFLAFVASAAVVDATVCDTPGYVDAGGWTCSGWSGFDCYDRGIATYGYSVAEALDLVTNCASSCADGVCNDDDFFGILNVVDNVLTGLDNWVTPVFGYGDTTFVYSGCNVASVCGSADYDDVCSCSLTSECGDWAESSAVAWCAYWDALCMDDDNLLIDIDDDLFWDDFDDLYVGNNVLTNNVVTNNVLTNNVLTNNVLTNNVLTNNVWDDNWVDDNWLDDFNILDDYDDLIADDDWYSAVCAGSSVTMSAFAVAAAVASVFALQAAF